MRILLLTQWFDPEPTFKGLAFARELTRLGHQVQVLTGFPNYPGGKVYRGYRVRLLQRERIDGIDIIRVPLYPSHSRSPAGRIANYLSFALSASVVGAFTARRPNVIYAYHPPATVGLPALLLRALFGAPLVYDVQDLWPDTVAATGMLASGRAMRLLSRGCAVIYAHSDHITVLSDGFKTALVARGVPEDKVTVIHNWCDEAQIVDRAEMPGPSTLGEWTGRFLVIFAGTMGAAQALDSVLAAAGLVASTRPDVQFLFIGGGTEVARLTSKVVDLGLTNVSFLPRVPFSAISPVLNRADALLVHLKDDPLFRITIPSKTQAYMATGRPILMAVGGDAAALVRQAGCGITCGPENPVELADAVERLAAMSTEQRQVLGDNGRRFYRSSSSLRVGAQQFESLFRRLHSDAPHGRVWPALQAPYSLVVKRVLDVVAAIVGLIVLSPIIAATGLLVRARLGSPVLFRQTRPGRWGRAFTILKFRTMRVRVPGEDDAARLTPFGRRLRALSLDELPELFNVLQGSMSLVGPRPLLTQYVHLYSPEQARRHDVRPGITGLAQVNGRNAITWERKFELDVQYVDRCSFALDARILARTVWQVLARTGISEPGHATASEFTGTQGR